MALFEIKNLTFTYPGQEEPALENLNFSVEEGEFLVICGKSGCGKSTLLRHFKTAMAPFGTRTGEILFDGRVLNEVSVREQGARIGYVLQSPDNQIVTDKVWHELAFGLENLGYDTGTIRLRVAEMASFFGIQTWFMKKVDELSGGQKQLLNLAAVMAMQPDILVLDEPTSLSTGWRKYCLMQTGSWSWKTGRSWLWRLRSIWGRNFTETICSRLCRFPCVFLTPWAERENLR